MTFAQFNLVFYLAPCLRDPEPNLIDVSQELWLCLTISSYHVPQVNPLMHKVEIYIFVNFFKENDKNSIWE